MEFSFPIDLFSDPRLRGGPWAPPSMPDKMLYFDVETTGLDPVKNDIIQFSGLLITSEEKDEINLLMRPYDTTHIDREALIIQNRTLSEVLSWPDPKEQFSVLEEWLENQIDRFDPEDKAIPVAFNAQFDLSFWTEYTAKITGDRKYGIGSWVKRSCTQDPLYVVRFLERVGVLPPLESHKLEGLCTFFNIPLQAHDAMSDVRALRELDLLLVSLVSDLKK